MNSDNTIAQDTDPEYYYLCQFVVQPKVVLPMRVIRYNVPHVMGLHFDSYSGSEEMKEMSGADGVMMKGGVEATPVKSDAEGMTMKSGAEGMVVKNEVQTKVEPSVLEIID